MEVYQIRIDIIVLSLANPSNKSVSQKVINFLDAEDLKILNKQLQKSQCHNSFTQLIRTYYFLKCYLNKIDRTFYYSFYAEPQFLNIQITQTSLLANNYSNCFFQFENQFKDCLNFIQKLFPESIQSINFTIELNRMITDTDIPMPKLKRQNQGIFCKTIFQNYLIYLKFRNECFNQYDEIFQNVNSYLLGKQQHYLQKLFMKGSKQHALGKKIRFLRFTPYQITYQNFQSYLVERNSLHNVLVGIFVLTDIWLNSIKSYISSLQDPFHRYVELVTRYGIYRNYVISVQQNLSFMFEQYNELYCQVFGNDKPTYRFWRPAMTKWILKFEQFHSQCSSMYYYCLTKQRIQLATQYIQQKQKQFPQKFMPLKNKLSLRQYQIQLSQTLFQNKMSNGVCQYFQKQPEQYQIITIQYMQYMIDLSINQESVHWCGHSQQILTQPFLSFEKYILAENKMYLNYVKQVTNGDGCLLSEYYTQQLQHLCKFQIKPITLTKFVQCYNDQLLQIKPENILDATVTSGKGQENSPDFLNQDESILIVYENKVNDDTLQYFNNKANIRYQLTSQEMCFYSISPLLSTDQILSKSINSTNCESQLMQADNQGQSECQMEYFSNSSDVQGYKDCPDLDQYQNIKYQQKKSNDHQNSSNKIEKSKNQNNKAIGEGKKQVNVKKIIMHKQHPPSFGNRVKSQDKQMSKEQNIEINLILVKTKSSHQYYVNVNGDQQIAVTKDTKTKQTENDDTSVIEYQEYEDIENSMSCDS